MEETPGTHFRHLPYRPASVSEMMPADPEDHRRILVIDDTEAIHSDFKKILGEGESTTTALEQDETLLFEASTVPVDARSFSVDSAYQGQEGLELVREALAADRPYPLAFVDVRMPPGWDGIETIEHIWREYPDLQVVICTAYSDYSWPETIQRLGQSDRLLILKKLFESVEVRQLACALTEKWKLNRQVRLEVANLHRSEEALRHKAQELQTALDALANARSREQLMASIPSICFGLGGDTVVTDWNLAAEKVFGWPAGEVVGKPLSSLPIAWPWERVEEAISRCHTQDQPVRIDEVRFVDKGGRERILGLTLNRIGTAADGTGGVVVVGADITERRQLQSQLQLAQKLESIGQLAAGVAHEINTPTQFVSDNTVFLKRAFTGLIDALNQGRLLLDEAGEGSVSRETVEQSAKALKKAKVDYLAKQVPRAIEQSLEGLDRVAKLVAAMKEFSHPSQGQKQPVDLAHTIDTTLTVARNEWKYVADVVTDFDPSLPPVPCVRDEFNQVILNMVVNAAHSISEANGNGDNERGTITIKTRLAGEWAEIHVSDTGTGIPLEVQQKIFDPFFTTKEVGKGTGQGLAIARSVVVDKHGGRIDVESEVGTGTTFVIRLPLVETAMEAEGVRR